MNILLWVRRHAVALGNAVVSFVALMSALVLHLNGVEMGAVVALVTALVSAAASWGVVSADRFMPIAVGVVKACLYLGVAFGLGAPWNLPGTELAIVAAVEGIFGLWVAQSVISAVPPVPPAVPPVR